MKQQRICIYPKDVEILTGKSARFARALLKNLQESLGKNDMQPITCCELGVYLNLDPEVIYRTINHLPLLTELKVSSE